MTPDTKQQIEKMNEEYDKLIMEEKKKILEISKEMVK